MKNSTKILKEINNLNVRLNECFNKIPKDIRQEIISLEKKKESWVEKYISFLKKECDKNGARTSNKKRYKKD